MVLGVFSSSRTQQNEDTNETDVEQTDVHSTVEGTTVPKKEQDYSAIKSILDSPSVKVKSFDEVNYYSALKTILSTEQNSYFSTLVKSEVASTKAPKIKRLSSKYGSYPNISYLSITDEKNNKKPIENNKTFYITQATFFRIELENENGFLASKLGTGVVDVVITENTLSSMRKVITFKKGDNYFSCFRQGGGQGYDIYSTFKYVDGFYIVQNDTSAAYSFKFYYSDSKITDLECSSPANATYGADRAKILPYSDWVFDVNYSFYIDDSEMFFNYSPDSSSNGLEFVSNGDGTCSVKGIGSCKDEHVVIPEISPNGEKVTAIKNNAFHLNTRIKSVVIPDSVNYLGSSIFSNCTNLETVRLPKDITYIPVSAFGACNSLKSIEIPDSVTIISLLAFAGCKNLESITLPDALKTIGEGAFSGCSSLRSIHIPQNVTKINSSLFRQCTALERITVDSRNDFFYSDGNGIIEKSTKKLIAGCASGIVPEDTQIIGEYAFDKQENLKFITIPASVTHIERSAFANCDSLKRIVYKGTSLNWEQNVSRDDGWSFAMPSGVQVECTDKIITLS